MDHICFDIICIMYFGSFGRILEHFVNFLKWAEKKFEVIFRSIFHPLFLSLLEIYMTYLSIVVLKMDEIKHDIHVSG
jgi:hypothetical protein